MKNDSAPSTPSTPTLIICLTYSLLWQKKIYSFFFFFLHKKKKNVLRPQKLYCDRVFKCSNTKYLQKHCINANTDMEEIISNENVRVICSAVLMLGKSGTKAIIVQSIFTGNRQWQSYSSSTYEIRQLVFTVN